MSPASVKMVVYRGHDFKCLGKKEGKHGSLLLLMQCYQVPARLGSPTCFWQRQQRVFFFFSFSAKVNRCNSLPRISEFRRLEWIRKISTLKKINMSNCNDMTVILGELAL